MRESLILAGGLGSETLITITFSDLTGNFDFFLQITTVQIDTLLWYVLSYKQNQILNTRLPAFC